MLFFYGSLIVGIEMSLFHTMGFAKWIVEKHQGYYEIVSREGLGTRFCVVFPKVSTQKKEDEKI